jgi:hypothetical protein
MKCLKASVSSDEEGTQIEFFLAHARFNIYIDKKNHDQSGWGFVAETSSGMMIKSGSLDTLSDGVGEYLIPYQYEEK